MILQRTLLRRSTPEQLRIENDVTCEGIGITKVYTDDERESDSESDPYTLAVDLTGCTLPDSPSPIQRPAGSFFNPTLTSCIRWTPRSL